MIPDLTPLFALAFFALGFVPVLLVMIVVSFFVPVPMWAGALAASVAGGIVVAVLLLVLR
ncbi:hypothetical protein JP74_21945 [Devosia sp. 17-2-E-8]|nr:hypothetical protein JP74_21945 [Devosia sp. 17-2-E-8]